MEITDLLDLSQADMWNNLLLWEPPKEHSQILHSVQTTSTAQAEFSLPVGGFTPDEEDIKMSMVALREDLFMLNSKLDRFMEEFRDTFTNVDLKKAKKNRTLVNRCTFVNRRGDCCKGYICKIRGSKLCYAHHIMATPRENNERRNKLY